MTEPAGDMEAFLREGVAHYLPAVRALSDFMAHCEAQLRLAAQPLDAELRSLNLVDSNGKFSFDPNINVGKEREEYTISASIRIPDRSALLVQLYPLEVAEESMWTGMWFWPKDAPTRTVLYERAEAMFRSDFGVEKHTNGTVYIGVYRDYQSHFPSFAQHFALVIRQILNRLREMDFTTQISPSLSR